MNSCLAPEQVRPRSVFPPLEAGTQGRVDALEPDEDWMDAVVDGKADLSGVACDDGGAAAQDAVASSPARMEQGADVPHGDLRAAIGGLAARLARQGLRAVAGDDRCALPAWFPTQGVMAAGMTTGALVASAVTAAGLASDDSLSTQTQTALEVFSVVLGAASGAALTIGIRALREFGFDCR